MTATTRITDNSGHALGSHLGNDPVNVTMPRMMMVIQRGLSKIINHGQSSLDWNGSAEAAHRSRRGAVTLRVRA
ncbi:MAG: hypothetical protein JWM58_736 [Rhizobium sp.]|nr:hypothetical protein [Rhizobium sp.]